MDMATAWIHVMSAEFRWEILFLLFRSERTELQFSLSENSTVPWPWPATGERHIFISFNVLVDIIRWHHRFIIVYVVNTHTHTCPQSAFRSTVPNSHAGGAFRYPHAARCQGIYVPLHFCVLYARFPLCARLCWTEANVAIRYGIFALNAHG